MALKHGLVALLVLAILLLHPGCYGSFNLTRSVHDWNGDVGSDWGSEAVFLLLVIIPVYGVTMLVDAIVLNSIEFWSGDNPVNEAYLYGGDGERIAALSRTETPDGSRLVCRLLDGDTVTGTFLLETRPDGVTYKTAADGTLLAAARPMPDGSLLVRDAKTGAERTYSRETISDWLAR